MKQIIDEHNLSSLLQAHVFKYVLRQAQVISTAKFPGGRGMFAKTVTANEDRLGFSLSDFENMKLQEKSSI